MKSLFHDSIEHDQFILFVLGAAAEISLAAVSVSEGPCGTTPRPLVRWDLVPPAPHPPAGAYRRAPTQCRAPSATPISPAVMDNGLITSAPRGQPSTTPRR